MRFRDFFETNDWQDNPDEQEGPFEYRNPRGEAKRLIQQVASFVSTPQQPYPSAHRLNADNMDIAAVIASETEGRPIKKVAYVGARDLVNGPLRNALFAIGRAWGLTVKPYAGNMVLFGRPENVEAAFNARTAAEFGLALGYSPEAVADFTSRTGADDPAPRYVICEPASHYYEVMTRGNRWMPALIDERI